MLFIAEWALAWLLLLGYAGPASWVDYGDSYALRASLAVLFASLVLIASVAAVSGGAFRFASLARANPWLALAVGAVLSGTTAYWLVRIVALVNDCAVGVAFPLPALNGVCQ